jgi:cytochrome c biogenesis protein CcmG, thiol:disulfide interchange protein DsbE
MVCPPVTRPKVDWLQVLTVAALLLGAVLLAFGDEAAKQPLEPSVKAPPLQVRALTGEPRGLIQGEVTVVAFWATWCGPCREELPRVLEVVAHRPGVRLLAVNQDEREGQLAAVQQWLSSLPALAPSVVLGDDSVARSWHVDALPTVAVIDREGQVRGSRTGTVTNAELEGWLDATSR